MQVIVSLYVKYTLGHINAITGTNTQRKKCKTATKAQKLRDISSKTQDKKSKLVNIRGSDADNNQFTFKPN